MKKDKKVKMIKNHSCEAYETYLVGSLLIKHFNKRNVPVDVAMRALKRFIKFSEEIK